MTKGKTRRPGPEPESLNIEGDWKKAVKKAIKVERPEGGWPQNEKPQKDPKETGKTK